MWRLLVAISFVLSTPIAAADIRLDLAEKFVRLLRDSDQYLEYRRACVTSGTSVTPESLVRDNPNRFEGMRPGMKHWPEVVEAYNKYFEEMCARPTEQEFLSALAKAYAQQLSAEDLKASIDFYSSAIGGRLIEAHRKAAGNVYSEWSSINSAAMPRADANYSRRIGDVAKKSGLR